MSYQSSAWHCKMDKGLLRMHENFHPKSKIQRLYTSRKEGEWGVMSVRADRYTKHAKIYQISKMAPKDKLLRECMKYLHILEKDQIEEAGFSVDCTIDT